MIINRSVWTMQGRLFPVLGVDAQLESLEYDDAPPPRECSEDCARVPRETEDDDA